MPSGDEFLAAALGITVSVFFSYSVLRQESPPAPRQPVPVRSRGEDRTTTNLFALATVAIGLMLLYSGEFSETPGNAFSPGKQRVRAILLVLMTGAALGYMSYVIVYVLGLSTKDGTFDADAIRLARDTLVSSLLILVTSALLFQALRMRETPDGPGDYLYFAAVTFSTLGYGDFTPSPDARPVAAILAILGNIHLAVLVGAALVALQSDDE